MTAQGASSLMQPTTTHRFTVEIETEPDPVYAINPATVRDALEKGGFAGHMGIEVKGVRCTDGDEDWKARAEDAEARYEELVTAFPDPEPPTSY